MTRVVRVALLICISLLSPATWAADTDVVYDAIERGRLALVAENYVEAGKALDQALHNPHFEALPERDQFIGIFFAAIAAQGREDYLGAHEYMTLATEYPEAGAEHWTMRARLAYWVENWLDAGTAITAVAKRWPKSLSDLDSQLVQRTAYKLQQDKGLGAARLAMLQELFAAGFHVEWGTEPSQLWQDLALDAAQRGDLKRAREVLQRIDDPGTLVRMRVDRRFDALLAAEPSAFDIAAAANAECRRWRDLTRQNPRKLAPLVQYLYSLMTVGDYPQILARADKAIAQNGKGTQDKPAFEDTEDQLNWIYDLRSQALRGMGRFDESLLALQAASQQREVSTDKVSQAINLGFVYTDMRRPEDALRALEGIDWAKTLSGYGRMQLQHVRLRAYLQLGKRDAAEEVFAWLRENRTDAQDTWQSAMLDWGDADGAAAQYITRLRDPDERADALYSAQTFRDRPRLPQETEEQAQWRALLDRKDVAAVIVEVGRREQQPVYAALD